MNIKVQWTNMDSDDTIHQYVLKKMEDAAKVVPSVLLIDCECKKGTHHQKGDIYEFQANVDIPGQLIRAEEVGQTIQEAIDKVKDELFRELRKYKNSQDAKQKKDLREFKEQTHLSPLADKERAREVVE